MFLWYLLTEVMKRRGGRPAALVGVAPRILKAHRVCQDMTVSDSEEVSGAKDMGETAADAVHSVGYVCNRLIVLVP